MPSALFTDRYSFYLNTNANGKGWVGIAPFALEGFSAYIPNTAYDGTAGVDTTSAGAPGRPFKPITESYNTGYHMNYA